MSERDRWTGTSEVQASGIARRVGLALTLAALAAGEAAAQDLQLVLSGECPGRESFTVAGASPGAELELYVGSARGGAEVPSGPCAGTRTGLADPTRIAQAVADATGRFSFEVEVPEALCDRLLQPLQVEGCGLGGAVRLETGVPRPAVRTSQSATEGSGDDGDLELGVAWPRPRFSDRGDGTVRDNLTGLIWLKRADCFARVQWAEAMEDARGLADGQCGLSDGSQAGDWRLPNIRELFVLYDQYLDGLPASHPFTGTSEAVYYWSSTTLADSFFVSRAWLIHNEDASTVTMDKFSLFCDLETCSAWPVRDPPELGSGEGSSR